MADDYYSTLRVAKTASAADVKKAYLQMARENHPDRFADPEEKKEADARFQQITEAYNQLGARQDCEMRIYHHATRR